MWALDISASKFPGGEALVKIHGGMKSAAKRREADLRVATGLGRLSFAMSAWRHRTSHLPELARPRNALP